MTEKEKNDRLDELKGHVKEYVKKEVERLKTERDFLKAVLSKSYGGYKERQLDNVIAEVSKYTTVG